MKKTLLMTARDVAAALHLVQVAIAFRDHARYDVLIAAQPPAAKHFIDAGFPVKIISALKATSAECAEAIELRAIARQLLADCSPDGVMVGLSTPFDAGIDEAVLAEAKVPTILFQDFWGEQNLLFGKPADLVLAVDDEANLLNLKRFGIRSQVVGSARHAAYKDLSIPSIRQKVRHRLGIAQNEDVIGFFGQALHSLPGYARTVDAFIKALAEIARPFRLIVRPHPREDSAQRRMTEALFKRAGIEPLVDCGSAVEGALIASDVVCSLFSTCAYDTAYLNRLSSTPVAVPISMLFDEEILAYCQQHVNFDTFPYHHSGVVIPVHDVTELASTLVRALEPSFRQDVWLRSHDKLPDPSSAPARVVAATHEFLCKDNSAGASQ